MDEAKQIKRMWLRIETLAEFSDPLLPYTRRSFSKEYQKSRAWLQEQFQEVGLKTWIDAGGNLIGRLEGKNPQLSPIMTGSHSDTVINGGKFDGITGVIAGLEVAQLLAENREQLNHPLEVIDFLGEEPSDYGISCIGSQALIGNLTQGNLEKKGSDGTSLAQGINNMGGESPLLFKPIRLKGDIAGFFELHIEQGPTLESANLPIGIVTDIVGITRTVIEVKGQADHAGTTPMEARRDALVGAAHIILHTNLLASAMPSRSKYIVATIGKIAVKPNNFNVVPGDVELFLEVRSSSDQVTESFLKDIQKFGRKIAGSQSLEINLNNLSYSPPTPCSKLIQTTIKRACEKNQLPHQFLSSGAGHDTRYMTEICPSGMIFIPSIAGRSHCPDELVTPQQLANGVTTLMDAIKIYDSIDQKQYLS
jgi:beta-ureidopropionase / N-carbamoyl-L-amino-acid hydrolase